ncbi:MAG: hypothetical protein Q8Q31_05040 [Nanoarchaeota archaeon]|nr:hypothetical protein [Nanoarchaeota archaeon]
MRIHICGIYGSGKSTFAKELSNVIKIPYYSLDDIKYAVKFTKIRPVEERIKKVKQICSKKNWITEGTWSNFAEEAFKKADLIILINTSRIICSYRIIKRHILRSKHENDTLSEALKLVKEVYKYHSTRQPVSLRAHTDLIAKYKKKHLVISKKSHVHKALRFLYQHKK